MAEEGQGAAPEGGAPKGKRILGMKPVTAYFVFGGALLAGIGLYIYKQRKAAAAGTSTATTGTAAGSGTDYSGELSAIQAELEALQSASSAGSTSGGGGGYSGGWGGNGDTGSGLGTGGTSTTDSSGGTGSGSGSGSTSTGSTSTGSTSTGSTPARKAGPPTGGRVVSVSASDAVVAWNANGATKWTVKITGPGPINGKTSTVDKPEATYSGLSSKHGYEVTVTPVAPNSAAPGVIHIETK